MYEFYERKEQIKKTLLVVSKAKITAANALRRSSKYDTEEPKSLQSAECGDNFGIPLRYGMVTLLVWSCKCILWVGVNIETVFWTPLQLIWLTPLRPLRLLEPLLIVWTITLSQSKTPLNLHHITCHLDQQRFSMARVYKVEVQPIIQIHSS